MAWTSYGSIRLAHIMDHAYLWPTSDTWTLNRPRPSCNGGLHVPNRRRRRTWRTLRKWAAILVLGMVVGGAIGAGIFTALWALGLR